MGIGLLEMELAKKADSASLIALKKEVELLRQEIKQLKTGSIERVEKVYYSVKDLSVLMKLEPNTIRRNYIQTGVIKAHTPIGSKSLVIEAKEFHRVKDIVGKYGVHYLRSMGDGKN